MLLMVGEAWLYAGWHAYLQGVCGRAAAPGAMLGAVGGQGAHPTVDALDYQRQGARHVAHDVSHTNQ